MLKLVKKGGFVSPLTIFSTNLNAPCSSILLAQSQTQRIYLIVGKINGETVFFPLDRSECISKFESELNEPITALACGDLKNDGHKETITVSSNGLLQSLRFPKAETFGDPPIPSRVFVQQLNANICACELIDVDMDGLLEFLVIMTDRVVRSYRFQTENSCLVALNKWEMPSQISGFSIGNSGEYFAFLSQACKSDFIKLDFGPNKEVKIISSNVIDRRHATLLFVPPNPKTIRLMQSLVEKIVIVDGDREIELQNKGGDFVCVSHARLLCGVNVIMTIDPWGTLLIYGFTSNNILPEPIARCQVLRDVDHVAAISGPSNYTLFLSLVNIYNKVAIYLVDLGPIIQVKQIV